MIVNPPLGIIKLNMSCTAMGSFLILLPYYQNESKSNIQNQFLDHYESYNGSNLQIWKLFISTMFLISQKQVSLPVLKDIKEIPMQTPDFNLPYKSRKSGQLSVPRWIYLATPLLTLTILRAGNYCCLL